MEKVIVYTQPNCKHSKSLIDLLNTENINYEERGILDPIHRKQAVDLGATEIPFTVAGHYRFSGYELSTVPRIKRLLSEGGALA